MKTHSTKWKSSKSKRKQRKYTATAPLHVKTKLMHSTLSKELRKKHSTRNVQLRTGDKVKIMRGNFKGQTGKVEEINIRKTIVYLSKIEVSKKDGTKAKVPFKPSNLKIIELNTSDPKRLKNKKKTETQKIEPKKEVKSKIGE